MHVNKFGEDGLYTRKSTRITDLYNKHNEPLFRELDMITEDGFRVNIIGNSVIDNSNLFKRGRMPTQLDWQWVRQKSIRSTQGLTAK